MIFAAAMNSRNKGWALLGRGDAPRPAENAPPGSPPQCAGNRRGMARAGPTEVRVHPRQALAAAMNSRNKGWALLGRGDAPRPAENAPPGSPPQCAGNRRGMARAGPTEVRVHPRQALAAAMNSRNKGWALLGRLFSSGWNWTPTNQGWPGSSTISTSRPSGERPARDRPAAVSFSR